MIAFVFATVTEAEPLLAYLKDTSLRRRMLTEQLHVYDMQASSAAVAVVGMGKTAATAGTRDAIHRITPQSLVNLGIAGGLTTEAVIGNVFRVKNAVDWPHALSTPVAFSSDGFEQIPGLDLVTTDEPVFDAALRRRLRRYGQMVDMEGAAIAAAAAEANIPCTAIKIISDAAKEGHREILKKNINEASKKLARLVAQMCFGR